MAAKLTRLTQNIDTTSPSGRELYHFQSSLQTASPGTFGYTLVLLQPYHKLQPWRWKQHLSSKHQHPTTTLHGATAQKTTNCIFTAVTTSNIASAVCFLADIPPRINGMIINIIKNRT